MSVGQNLDKIVDEWTHAQYLDSDTYMERMVRTYCFFLETRSAVLCTFWHLTLKVAHWDTFVTEDDFATLAGAGVSHVRVPIAYWLVSDLPYLSRLSGTGQLRKASRFPPQTQTTTTLRTPSSSWEERSAGWTNTGWRRQWTCIQVNCLSLTSRQVFQDLVHRMVTTTAAGEARSVGQQGTTPKNEPTLTGADISGRVCK